MKPYRNLFLLAILSMVTFSLSAQKVKYKKGKVLVNKEHTYNFKKLKPDSPSKSLNNFVLEDLDAKVVFELKDTVFYYDQLPNEKTSRIAYEAYICSIPDMKYEALMPYNAILNYPKRKIKELKKVGFFKDSEFSKEAFDEFIKKQYPKAIEKNLESIVKINPVRVKNYELNKAKFGDLLEREPAKPSVKRNFKKSDIYFFKEGETVIATVKLTNKGSHNHAYSIINSNSEEIGAINIFQNIENKNGTEYYKYNVKHFALGEENSKESFKWFYKNLNMIDKSNPSLDEKLENIVNYLVNNGLL